LFTFLKRAVLFKQPKINLKNSGKFENKIMKYLKKKKLHLKKVENKNKKVSLIALLIYPHQAYSAPAPPPP
jgi:hypothetical protein